MAKLADGISARIRTGRLGAACIEWSEPTMATLGVQLDPRGQACGLFVQGLDFAEFDPREHAETPTLFIAEDYALEILEA